MLDYLPRLAEAGITLCGQLVLCRGINDGEHLDRTLHDLMEYLPALDSVSIVPAGLTKYREGLPELTLFTPEECRAVIKQGASYGDYCMQKYGTRVFLCSDEFYVRGGLELPDEDFEDTREAALKHKEALAAQEKADKEKNAPKRSGLFSGATLKKDDRKAEEKENNDKNDKPQDENKSED